MGKSQQKVAESLSPEDRHHAASLALAEAATALLAAINALRGDVRLTYHDKPRQVLDPSPLTIRALVAEFIQSRERCGRTDRYLRQLRVPLNSFTKSFGKKAITAVTRKEVEKWLFSNHRWSVRTMKNSLSDIKTLFNFALKRGYLERDIATCVDLPTDPGRKRPVEIHSPEEAGQVLEAARKVDLDVMRLLAIRYFAGLRSAEVKRLGEEHILPSGYIEVPAHLAKTRQRRLVKIQPNLGAWLALGGVLGPVGDMRIRAVLKASEVKWKHNATRHSFVSYHLAKFQSASKTALEAGHSETMLFSHYREIVTPEAAEKFWAIVPQASAGKT